MSHIKEEKNKKFEYAVRMSLSLCYTVYIEILTDSLRFHIVFFHWNGSVSHANEHLINTNNDFSRISFSSFFSFNLEEISTLWWHCLNWILLLGFLLRHIWDRISGWYWVKVEHNTTHFSPCRCRDWTLNEIGKSVFAIRIDVEWKFRVTRPNRLEKNV